MTITDGPSDRSPSAVSASGLVADPNLALVTPITPFTHVPLPDTEPIDMAPLLTARD